MKFGVTMHKPKFKHIKKGGTFNIGDCVQSIALKYLYNKIGIKNEDIVEINKYDISSYDGSEYVILPLCNSHNGTREYGVLPVSNKIIPVFTSFNLFTKELDNGMIDNLKSYEPIGCRDEQTMINMRNHNILAYMTGCITAILPKRPIRNRKNKTFFVDIPDSLNKFIPDKLKKNCEYLSHLIPIESDSFDDNEVKRMNKIAIDRLEQYKNEATLVVTSRLHCAVPCMAMGIPVIIAANNYPFNFGWVDRFLPVHTSNDFDSINWNPKIVEYEDVKQRLVYNFGREIIDKHRCNKKYNISELYENRVKGRYNNYYLDILDDLKCELGDNLKFAVWGAILMGSMVIDSIEKVFDNYEITVIDTYSVEKTFEGYKIERPENIKNYDKDTIYIIAAGAAKESAISILEPLNLRYICITTN
jgi:hypothetical protein